MGNGRNRAYKAFRVDGTLVVEVVVAEQVQVYLREDVRFSIVMMRI